ncbi:uncharacterized protein BT62DRAFT_925271 [Guyanagaster necrorhizus]|uniref:Uncharacterized protein n=1 Tax=Guyanagaster necrorhizus TaxID=856835 RepID=A0A9P7W4W6_9AGAR|nr:uncharacterized protein BT62DRAFT_925271 [Guyanagaster necrorhizus MCA 3950]KAG7452728.1 hypothetical protein BT62DRAFT_925271 [Guyanagaster necrorhizus MCA 3950]
MAGPNLEIFKFSVYLFVPIWALVHFGDPSWYRNNVLPYKDKLFPPTVQKEIPTEQKLLREQLAQIKADRITSARARSNDDS